MLPPSSGTIERHSQQHQRHQHPETSRQPISAGATTSAGRAKKDGGSARKTLVAIGVALRAADAYDYDYPLPIMIRITALALQLVAAFAIVAPLSTFGQSGIPLKQGMGYAQARQLLLKSGWQTKATSWQERYCPEFLGARCRYPEVESCAPTGTGPCIFNWLNVNGKTLSVYTNSDRGGNTTISNWTLK